MDTHDEQHFRAGISFWDFPIHLHCVMTFNIQFFMFTTFLV